jgi:S-adenosylmethionine synthetase
MSRSFHFTSESVTEGHPDKLADQISDAVLDNLLAQDPTSRVACESLLTTGTVIVAGEITTKGYVELPELIRETIREVGYTRAEYGLDFHSCGVLTAIQKQSPDIAMGVDTGGAGDQGMMFGYACTDTPELMPMPIMQSHKLARRLAAVRKDGTLPYLRPDGKTQVTVRYEDGNPVCIDAVLISTQHDPDATQAKIKEDLIQHVILPILPKEMIHEGTAYYVNPTGNFVVGGPQGDTGLTGRKIIVDSYGGFARHGGGAFSGKDPTKVDRSAAYMMRYVAKNIVAAGLAERCELEVAYAIGMAQPLSVFVDTFGTGKVPDTRLEELVRANFDLSPAGIIERLDLRRPIYQQTAAYGHFGRTDLDVTWERTDAAETLKNAA